jgi:hypothetical protein
VFASEVTGNINVTKSFLVFALVAGAVGMGSMLAGLDHIMTWTLESYCSSAAVAAMSLILTFEALGYITCTLLLGTRLKMLTDVQAYVISA